MDTDAVNKDNFSVHYGVELLTRVELYTSCSSEKLLNLNALMMNVATKERELESFASEKEDLSADSFIKALEFDLLSRILCSEARELQIFMTNLHTETVRARELISSCKNLAMEEKLLGSEESLKQLQEQVLDIRTQSGTLTRTLTCFNDEDNIKLSTGTRIKMETEEQQRDILIILERSLSREMSLEKKLTESRQVQEELKQNLLSYETELCYIEEETCNVWGKLFEAEYLAEVLLGISKELLSRINIIQLNLNGSLEREDELKSKFEAADKNLKSQESTLKRVESGETRLNDFFVAQTEILKVSLSEIEEKLILVSSEAFSLREKVTSLENQLKSSDTKVSAEETPKEDNDLQYQFNEFENVTEDLKEKLSKAENKVESAEARCKLLAETNMELNNEVCLEKQSMLDTTIGDMENLIEDLKLKVLESESRADNAEDKCVVLSESHADLSKEVDFLRGRTECLEAALHQSEGMKLDTEKDVGVRTKVITDLVVQLAIQRERLHKQISLLAEENKILVMKLQQKNENSSACMSRDSQENGKHSEMNKNGENMSVVETEIEPREACEIGTIRLRRIDAGVLNIKHVLVAILVLLISAAVYLFKQGNADEGR